MIRAILFALVALVSLQARAATDPQRVVSPGGIEAWLIEDHKVPVLSLRWSFLGGWALDPAGKEGLVEFACTLMDEGAGDLDSQTFQKKLADANIAFGISPERDRLSGSLKVLTQSRDLGVELAALALTKPRFDEDAVERMRAATLSNIQAELAKPGWIAGRALAEAIYGNHPYAHPQRGTLASVKTITGADMKAFMSQRLARDTLMVAVAGDIDAKTLGPLLDKLFGGLPATSPKVDIADVQLPTQGKTIVVERPIPQTIVVSATQGVRRSDPQWYAASLMNYVLGGGSFNSRLMEEIRDKRGLTYGVSSGLASYEHAASLQASGATKNQTAQQFVDLLKEEFKKMADRGVTQKELDEAKAYQTGSLPLSMTSTDKIAALLLQLRQDNLGIDYLKKRNAMINAVTLAEVNAVAKKLLDPAKLTVVMVGKPTQ
ncbi:M16 family metallopeptidase [Roseiterribacter gracilis]|uniref:Peptidase M16 n=1 Tax=Roseiterribacter gracilis TaxID=2812848 RepID=A0A8S8XAH7_9PROT|nr:peptidase M16 [Rhodospirillales bacterium TMPK1]